MSEFSRRDMLSAAAAGGMIAAATSTDGLAEGQPPFGPTPPVLAGAQLPSFRFQLGAVAPKSWNGGWAKEATVAQFPVSEKLAGVLMSLNPGGLRELHWHANAAEWAYVIKGQCRVTTINPQGQSQIADFAAGDVWYFPRGFGHSIQGIGAEDCLFVLVFDNGYFSEFGTFSISDWVGHTPPEVLAKNFGVAASTFANFPKREVYIAKGPVPPPLPADPAPGTINPGTLTHRYRLLAQRPDTYPGGTNRLVSQREFPISTTITGALMRIKPGGMRELHWHPNADEWQYYIGGRARMSVFGSNGRVRMEEFNAGDVGYVPQGYGHYIENAGSEDLELLIVLNNGTYESISLANWIGANPHLLLATNFEVPESTFKDFLTRDRFMPG
ncbi:MAG TPA: cupin domain-containing protein [Xanthobacteraceae bacterium]|jgi:oxalate decarboxylase|nr:cupin domain-containing protein [Xanthobacteraceae bacterium]